MGIFKKANNIEENYKLLLEKYTKLEEECEALKKEIDYLNSGKSCADLSTIERVDKMGADKFAPYIKYILGRLDYINVSEVMSSDLNLSLFAEKDNISYAIRCHLSTDKVLKNVVLETHEGKKISGRDVGVIITNGKFDDESQELSRENGILLWDREVLESMLQKVADLDIPVDYDFSAANDPLVDEVIQYVVDTQKVSVSLLQRRFRIGYNRAARIVDLLEERKIVGPANGTNPREVLMKKN